MSKPGDWKRGRHRKRRSPETARWHREHLVPPRPAWMPKDVYRKLVAIRNQEEPDA